ncbi:MAG: hypothetical protein M1834_001643 [Cirrosporium novae-zelandiae]|nr:MAG: hypothetical protein M1834_004160 [Cirrosporium novae-zelandiae]KAI9735627.1 MAG: hypothetical protein M1834_001643 [Cirrosporium novae-zelandiae]
MAEVFYKDTDLQRLYLDALRKFGKETFSRNHDCLLKKLLKDLKLTIQDNSQLLAFLLSQIPTAEAMPEERGVMPNPLIKDNDRNSSNDNIDEIEDDDSSEEDKENEDEGDEDFQ